MAKSYRSKVVAKGGKNKKRSAPAPKRKRKKK